MATIIKGTRRNQKGDKVTVLRLYSKNKKGTSMTPDIIKKTSIIALPICFGISNLALAADWSFPSINESFSELSELQREPFADKVKAKTLSGSGNIAEVGKCGFMDESKKHGRKCLLVTIDDEIPRAVLYFPKEKLSDLSNLNVGNRFSFDNCSIIDIKDWGIWTTVYCDMP